MPVPTLPTCFLSLSSVVACMVAGPVHAAADNCEPLRLGIEANIASKGLSDFTVTVVDADSALPGQVVGQCGNGSKKILYLRGSSLGPSPAASGSTSTLPAPKTGLQKPASALSKSASGKGILTECKDGSVSMGGNCKP